MRAELREAVDNLHLERELAPPAAPLSQVAGHYDRAVGLLVASRDPAVVRALLARAGEAREVRRAAPPHHPVEGGYGKPWGRVTVADKARFALARLLGEALAAQALAPGWWQANGARLRWDAKAGRFVVQ